jgi:hypothetical protein
MVLSPTLEPCVLLENVTVPPGIIVGTALNVRTYVEPVGLATAVTCCAVKPTPPTHEPTNEAAVVYIVPATNVLTVIVVLAVLPDDAVITILPVALILWLTTQLEAEPLTI